MTANRRLAYDYLMLGPVSQYNVCIELIGNSNSLMGSQEMAESLFKYAGEHDKVEELREIVAKYKQQQP